MVQTCVLILSMCFFQPERFAEANHQRYGQIVLEGNKFIADGAILEMLPLRPGAVIVAADVHAARAKLRKCGLFKTNPWRRIEPTIEFHRSELDDIFIDVRIRIEEKPGLWLTFCLSNLLCSLVWFDLDHVKSYLFGLWHGVLAQVQSD